MDWKACAEEGGVSFALPPEDLSAHVVEATGQPPPRYPSPQGQDEQAQEEEEVEYQQVVLQKVC